MKINLLQWSYSRGKRDFSRIQLQNADLSRARLKFICLSQANLQGAVLSQGQFAGADFVYAQLQDADLREANCIGANFLAANLQRANLSRAMLCGSLLSVTDLSGAQFVDATLAGADLRSANLTGANLRGANLQGANLTAANLTGANLEGADLEGATLTGAILPQADGDRSAAELAAAEAHAALLAQAVAPPKGSQGSGSKSLKSRKAKVKGGNYSHDFQDIVLYPAEAKTDGDQAKGAENRALDADWATQAQDTPAASDSPATTGLTTMLQTVSTATTQTEAHSRLQRSIALRKGPHPLRRQLLQSYDDRCAISRCSVTQVLEVAYLMPAAGDLANDPCNALLLRSDLHLLLDLHLITINPHSYTVEMAPWLHDSYYGSLNGRSLYFPLNTDCCPSLEAITYHYEQCEWEHEEAWSGAYVF